jgi:hypothetical protein
MSAGQCNATKDFPTCRILACVEKVWQIYLPTYELLPSHLQMMKHNLHCSQSAFVRRVRHHASSFSCDRINTIAATQPVRLVDEGCKAQRYPSKTRGRRFRLRATRTQLCRREVGVPDSNDVTGAIDEMNTTGDINIKTSQSQFSPCTMSLHESTLMMATLQFDRHQLLALTWPCSIMTVIDASFVHMDAMASQQFWLCTLASWSQKRILLRLLETIHTWVGLDEAKQLSIAATPHIMTPAPDDDLSDAGAQETQNAARNPNGARSRSYRRRNLSAPTLRITAGMMTRASTRASTQTSMERGPAYISVPTIVSPSVPPLITTSVSTFPILSQDVLQGQTRHPGHYPVRKASSMYLLMAGRLFIQITRCCFSFYSGISLKHEAATNSCNYLHHLDNAETIGLMQCLLVLSAPEIELIVYTLSQIADTRVFLPHHLATWGSLSATKQARVLGVVAGAFIKYRNVWALAGIGDNDLMHALVGEVITLFAPPCVPDARYHDLVQRAGRRIVQSLPTIRSHLWAISCVALGRSDEACAIWTATSSNNAHAHTTRVQSIATQSYPANVGAIFVATNGPEVQIQSTDEEQSTSVPPLPTPLPFRGNNSATNDHMNDSMPTHVDTLDAQRFSYGMDADLHNTDSQHEIDDDEEMNDERTSASMSISAAHSYVAPSMEESCRHSMILMCAIDHGLPPGRVQHLLTQSVRDWISSPSTLEYIKHHENLPSDDGHQVSSPLQSDNPLQTRSILRVFSLLLQHVLQARHTSVVLVKKYELDVLRAENLEHTMRYFLTHGSHPTTVCQLPQHMPPPYFCHYVAAAFTPTREQSAMSSAVPIPLYDVSLVTDANGRRECILPPESHCSICQSSILSDENYQVLPPCGHVVHDICVSQWFQVWKHNTCPLCRQVVSYADPLTCTAQIA